jgi:hypothetical protein
MRRFMWKVNNSNIAYNKTTHQFGEIWWKTNGGGSKIGSCGVWPDEEYITLTIVEAKRLYEFDKPNSSWSSPSKECIKFVFGKEWNEIK